MTWLALSDAGTTTIGLVVVGAITTIGTVAVAIIGRSSRKAIDDHASVIQEQLKTDNGHTLGQAAARIEDQAVDVTGRLDRLQVIFSEHVEDSKPVVEWVHKKMREESSARGRREGDGDLTSPQESP